MNTPHWKIQQPSSSKTYLKMHCRRLRSSPLLRALSARAAGALILLISGCAAASDSPSPQEKSAAAPSASGAEVRRPLSSSAGGTSPSRSRNAADVNPLNPPLAQKGTVTVKTMNGGQIQVQVEIASVPRDRARGLMYRRSLGPNEGMLFVFPQEDQLTFWMENTYLPLDMLFIRGDGTVLGIVENAEPLTRTSRSVSGNSKFVLEVNGGFCARHHIAAGDRVKIEGSYKVE